jgi:hypothetical protein
MIMLFFVSQPAFSQYFSGTNMGSYSGVSNVMVNPALLSNSRYYLDVNVISGGSFAHNNYAYLSTDGYNVTKFLNPGYEMPMHEKEYGQGERPAYTVENKRAKEFFVNGRVIGPSVMVSVNDHTFAMHTSFRSVNSVRDLPYDMANYFYYSLDYKPQHGYEYEHRDPIKFGTLTWSEIGISWAYQFSKDNRDRWSFGVSAKMLFGHAGSYVYVENMKYFVPDADNLYVRNIDGEAAYALPVDYNNNELYSGSKINGMGMGVDLGLSYTHTYKGHSNLKYKRLCQQRFEPYKYRIGVSLMDFGYIRFNDRARKYEYHNESGYWQQVDTLIPYYDNLAFMSSDISTRFSGSEESALVDDKFSMYLPATLGVQFDYNYTKNWYVSGAVRVPLSFAKNQVRAPWSMMVSPRIETQVFEIGTPVSLYDMRYPMIGAYMRFYNFTLGTDNLGGFLNVTNHYGFDVYFSFKINFIKNRCKRKMPRFCG